MLYSDAISLMAPGGEVYVSRLSMLSKGWVVLKRKNGVLAQMDVRSGSTMPHDPTRHETNQNDWVLCKIERPNEESDTFELIVQHVGADFMTLTQRYPHCAVFRRLSWDKVTCLNKAEMNGEPMWTRYFPHPQGWMLYTLTEEDLAAKDWIAQAQTYSGDTAGERIVARVPDDNSEEGYVIKKHLADSLNILHQLREEATTPEKKRLISIAMTELEGADLWVSKALGVEQ